MEQLPVEYPVGLTREEYIRSQILLTRGNRAFGIIPLVTAVMFLLILAVDMIVTRQVDIPLTVMVVVVAAAEIATAILAPQTIRRRHGETYDQARYGGYCFDGMVKVTETQISKTTSSGETVIPFNGCYYLEAADMMIFRNQHGKSIVIPARCFTEADANATRVAAMGNVPPTARRLQGRLIPGRQERLPVPSLEKPLPEDPLVTVAVEYTPKELTGLSVDAAFDSAFQRAPSHVLLAAVLAMLVYDVSSLGMVATFLLTAMVLTLLPVFAAGIRTRRAIAATEGTILKLAVELTPSFLRLRGAGEQGRQLEIPWEEITRGVELPTRMDLYAGKKIVSLPKRCMTDVEEVRRVIDKHLSE